MPDFDAQVTNCTEKWNSRVVSPYVQAYTQAHARYQETVAAAEKAREAQMALFASLATILSTSVIMGAFAGVSISRMATRMGLRTIGRQNTLAVVRLYSQSKTNPIVTFASGKVWDLAKDKMADQTKEIFLRLARNTASGVTGVLPLVRDKQMQQMVSEQGICLKDGHEGIMRDNRLAASERTRLIDEMKASRFMHPPERPLDVAQFEDKILLSMYMQKVLDMDYTMTRFPPDVRTPPIRGGGIDALPSDTKNYPRSEKWEGQLGTYRTVEVDRPGSEFEDATDEAFAKVYGKGKSFYGTSGWVRWAIPDTRTGTPAQLVHAEKILNDLSFRTRPKAVQELVA